MGFAHLQVIAFSWSGLWLTHLNAREEYTLDGMAVHHMTQHTYCQFTIAAHLPSCFWRWEETGGTPHRKWKQNVKFQEVEDWSPEHVAGTSGYIKTICCTTERAWFPVSRALIHSIHTSSSKEVVRSLVDPEPIQVQPWMGWQFIIWHKTHYEFSSYILYKISQ